VVLLLRGQLFKMRRFERFIFQIGEENFKKINNSKVLILGIGGVGSYAAEALARSGVGTLILVDYDKIDITNINRQIPALTSTIGKYKTDVLSKRIKDVNPTCKVITFKLKYSAQTKETIFNEQIDFAIDACDDINAKLSFIEECLKRKISFISSMAMGNKFSPKLIKISELKKTKYDPIAKILRKKLKERKIEGKIPVIYSEEKPIRKTKPVSSNAFLPSIAGLYAASYAIKFLLKEV
jgi:tRNA A37 threonylcarbamoyladenosine dehydratase